MALPDARRRSCEQELTLNRRLAAPTYLNVVALNRAADGTLHLDGAGPPVDWLVRMRQLPQERMLDTAIRRGTVRMDDLDALVSKLVRFQQLAPVAETDGLAFRTRLGEQLRQIRSELLRAEFGLSRPLVETVSGVTLDYLNRHAGDLDDRVARGFVRELHGDLRPEHVCLGPDPQVIDCIEFDRELRVLDCAQEMAFLAMECERLGARRLAASVLHRYREVSGDSVPDGLLAFYQAERAAMRAMLQVWHLRDAAVADPGRWMTAGSRYLRQAWRYLAAAGQRRPPADR
jgi:aminoglycoside phosphotransferase family enzyme